MKNDWKGIEQLERTKQVVYRQDRLALPDDNNRCLRIFDELSPKDVKVLVVGQDPYHTPGKASGLAFGYHPDYLRLGGTINSSLLNIRRQLKSEGYELNDLTLESWVKQGVMLVNTLLTVSKDNPLSHKGYWATQVEAVIKDNLQEVNPVVLAWGAHACLLADACRFTEVIKTTHPCKYSAERTGGRLKPFIGSNCFSSANSLLHWYGKGKIEWGS